MIALDLRIHWRIIRLAKLVSCLVLPSNQTLLEGPSLSLTLARAPNLVFHPTPTAAKIKGCRVIAIAGSEEKNRWLRETCGIDETLNYKDPNFKAYFRKKVGYCKPISLFDVILSVCLVTRADNGILHGVC